MTLYTMDNCPKCKMLKQKLEDKHIEIEIINDYDVLCEKGIESVPVLEVNGEKMNYAKANTYINNL